VRSAERFEGRSEPLDPVAGHIPGACNLPQSLSLAADGRFQDPAALHALFAAQPALRHPEDVVCMCGSGVTACHTLLAMEVAGLPGGRLYPGSWSEWCRDPARPVATGPA
jgi:thiosulfate/3-mercaptopyruvate sulfurtransferase